MNVSKLKNEVGIYHNIRPEDYFRLGIVREDGSEIERGSDEYIMSRSALREFARCPRAWQLGRPRPASKAFKFGNLMDAICLTPMMIDELIIVQPVSYNQMPEKGSYVLYPESYNEAPADGSYTLTSEYDGEWKPNTKACREWKAEQTKAGKEVITPESLEDLKTDKPWNGKAGYCREWKAAAEARGLVAMSADEYEELCVDKPWNNLAGHCKEWNSRVPRGVEIISADLNAEGHKAMARVREDDWFSHILAISQTQTVVVWDWKCPVSSEVIRCKAMLDVVPPANGDDGILIDLKTTVDAHADAWNRHVFKFGYHYQGAMYCDGYNSAAVELDLDDQRVSFGHLIIESSPPYETAKRLLSDDWITAGRNEYEADLMRYAGCRKTGNFYGYTDNVENGFEIVACPGWVTHHAKSELMLAQDDALMEGDE